MLTLSAGPLQVVFEKQGDRYAHRIYFTREDDAPILLLSSIEGDPSQAWPPSPALQEVHLEGRGEKATILGVGMAGKNHWSLSVEAVLVTESPDDESEDDADNTDEFSEKSQPTESSSWELRFDVACRVREELFDESLGNHYQQHWREIWLVHADTFGPDGSYESKSMRLPGEAVVNIDSDWPATRFDPDDVRFYPTQLDSAKLPVTVRWRYSISHPMYPPT